MNRRDAVLALIALGGVPFCALAAAPGIARSQDATRVRRVGFFILTTAGHSAGWLAGFRKGMAEPGWVEGRDFLIDARYANGVANAGPALAAELVAARSDVVLTGAEQAVQMLVKASPALPVVFAISKDPVASGVAASLPRPGGTATGLTDLSHGLGGKKMQLLKEAFPQVRHVGLLFDPKDIAYVAKVKEIEAAAVQLTLRISRIALPYGHGVEQSFKLGAASGVEAYQVVGGALVSAQRQPILDGIRQARVPAILTGEDYLDAGGLMTYSASQPD